MNYEPLYTFAEKHRVPYNELCTALRAALAAPQPEPVAEVIDREHQPWEHGKHTSWLVNPSDLPAGTKLYAAAPPAAPAPVVPVAWEYQNQHGDRFLTHRDPAKWHENDRAGFNNFRALGYAAPAVPLTDEQFADIVAEASLAVDLAANPLKLLAFARAVLSAAPAVREPQDERIRWRDAVIKEAESALRTAEQELSEMPTWANVGHAAKKVTHALAVIAALGIGGGSK